jgi:hypothetical protein
MKFSGTCLNPKCEKALPDKRRNYCSDDCRPHEPCRRSGCPNLTVSGRNSGYCSSECRDIAKKERVEALAARQKASAKEKGPTHYEVRKAEKEGRLVRQPCEVSGSLKTDAHHPDYANPLDVRWLSRSEHTKEHSRLRKLAKSQDLRG